MTKLTIKQALETAKSHASRGEHEVAAALYKSILQSFPSNTDAKKGLTALKDAQRAARERKALKTSIDQLLSLYNQGQLEVAMTQAIELSAQYPKAIAIWNILGASSAQLGKLEQAVQAFKQITTLNPNQAVAYFNMGNALKDQGKIEEAMTSYNKALSIKPDYQAAINNLVVALKSLGKNGEEKAEEALATYNQAQAAKSKKAFSILEAGVELVIKDKLEEGIATIKHSLSILPDFPAALNELASIFITQGKLNEAISCYERSLLIKPEQEEQRAYKLHEQAKICDWEAIDTEQKLIETLGCFTQPVDPFRAISLEDAPERHRIRSEIYAAAKYPQKPLPAQVKPSQKPKPIRLGYFSTDFKEHPVAYLIAKMLEQHDRDQFEVFGYSLHGNQQNDMRQRLSQSFDSFADVQGMTDRDVALQAWQDGIDIAIDLNGYTKDARTGIFAYRAAPIQINYLGYPGTLGADFMDYIVADKFLIPEENQKYFSEKPIYLPHTYMPTDNTRELSQEPMSRKDVGLPDDAFVFCAINNSYKINSDTFEIWMRLLNKVEGSVLWLFESNEFVKRNLIKEAKKFGLASEKLVFAPRASHERYLLQFCQADLFVDTFPYNAGATACDALWSGLPIITKSGQSYTARMAGSLLNAIGLPELATTTEQDYEALILDVATNPTKLAKIKEKLDANRLTHPLFNTELYTKHLENGYQQAYQNYFDGNKPSTIIVPER